MHIVNKNVDDIIPYERNPRKNDHAVDAIAASIQEFGFLVPIILDNNDVIICGHTRLKAAQKLGLKEVPCVIAAHLSQKKTKALRLLDNKISEKAEWERELLAMELDDLADYDFAPFDVDWDLPNTEVLADDSQDSIPELSEQTQTELGDIWLCGPHRILCGDSTSAEGINSLFTTKAGQVSLLITDPPYGVSYVGKTRDALTIDNDSLSDTELERMWGDCLDTWLPNLVEGGSIYASVPAGPLHIVFLKEMIKRELLHQCLVWAKDSMVLGHSDYHYKHEPILYGWKPGAPHYFVNDRTKTTLLEFDRPKASREHPTMKPLDLWMELIKNSSKPKDIICDPFLGSGTTLIAAQRLHRVCYGTELDPKYCDVILERYYKETEEFPTRESDGKTFCPRHTAYDNNNNRRTPKEETREAAQEAIA